MISNVRISNLETGTKAEDLRTAVVRIWPKCFPDTAAIRAMNITMYDNGQVATIYNIHGFIEEMIFLAEESPVLKRCMVVKPDQRERRNEEGNLVNSLTGLAHREKSQLFGVTTKKLWQIFDNKFLYGLSPLLRTLESGVLHIPDEAWLESQTRVPGTVLLSKPQERSPFLRKLSYSSVIAAVQATNYFSGQTRPDPPAKRRTAAKVYNTFGTAYSSLSNERGLGLRGAGTCLNVEELHRTLHYVPFSAINPSYLNPDILNSKMYSRCWRCNSSFTLLGISRNLDFIAGQCLCRYGGPGQQDGGESYRPAYGWEFDQGQFTRLSGGSFGGNHRTFKDLVIWHQPAQYDYSSRQQYYDIMLPLIEEEWFVSSEKYGQEYKITGTVASQLFLELIGSRITSGEDPDSGERSVYTLEVDLVGDLPNRYWNADTRLHVKELALRLEAFDTEYPSGRRRSTRFENVGGRLYNVRETRTGTWRAIINVSVEIGLRPVVNTTINISPIPVKDQYDAMRKFLKDFVLEESEEEINPVLPTILPRSRRDLQWNFLPENVPLDKDTNVDGIIIETIRGSLNTCQVMALKRAIFYNFCVIQGPPGTGKTELIASITAELSVTEMGLVVLTAQSNAGCDSMGERVYRKMREIGAPCRPRVMRVMAKSRQTWIPKGQREQGRIESSSCPILHELVFRDKAWNSAHLAKIVELMDGNLEHRLTTSMSDTFALTIKSLENKYLRQADVVVCTMSTLLDGRVSSYARILPVTTILVEEAGQLRQAELLNLQIFRPKRVILVGDHLQLRPQVSSMSAGQSGLGWSHLEWLSYAGNDERDGDEAAEIYRFRDELPPWTTLKVQYRMAEDIRKVVSNLTYRGQLVDGPNIRQRKTLVSPSVISAFPQLSTQSVMVYDQKGTEKMVGRSVLVLEEVQTVFHIVMKLRRAGVPPHEIVTLTLYEAQNEAIRGVLKGSHLTKDVDVKNVDAFQGKEREYVIVSVGRSNSKGKVGFAADPSRLNVGLSRAMLTLFVVVDLETFREHGSGFAKSLVQQLNPYVI